LSSGTPTADGSNCPLPTIGITPLTGTVTPFATTASGADGHVASATVDFTVNGSYTIPLGSSGSAIAASITLSITSL